MTLPIRQNKQTNKQKQNKNKNKKNRGAWVAQLVKHLTSAQGHDIASL